MEAWIEIQEYGRMYDTVKVAPLVEAWIEIVLITIPDFKLPSLLSWKRGLKYQEYGRMYDTVKSLLSWKRGLKYD